MRRNQRGLSGSVQVTLLLPFVLGLFLLALQWSMLVWAQTTAQAAAQDGARQAAAFGATAAQGRDTALAAANNASLDNVAADVSRGPVTTSAIVSGVALRVIPGFPVSVQESASAPTERLSAP